MPPASRDETWIAQAKRPPNTLIFGRRATLLGLQLPFILTTVHFILWPTAARSEQPLEETNRHHSLQRPVLPEEDARRVEELSNTINDLCAEAKYAEAIPLAEEVWVICTDRLLFNRSFFPMRPRPFQE